MLCSLSSWQAASDDNFEGHESAAFPAITSDPQKTVKILTAAGWTFFETWKEHSQQWDQHNKIYINNVQSMIMYDDVYIMHEAIQIFIAYYIMFVYKF